MVCQGGARSCHPTREPPGGSRGGRRSRRYCGSIATSDIDAAKQVIDQLRVKAAALRGVAEPFDNGGFIEPVRRPAQDQATWGGDVQMWFCGWLDEFGGWLRICLGGGLFELAERIGHRITDLENLVTQLGMGLLPPPLAPLKAVGKVPGPNPGFVMRLPHPPRQAVSMAPEPMRHLANSLFGAKDALLAQGRVVRDNLEPVVIGPAGLGATLVGAAGNLPPDAAEAVGYPRSFTDAATQLDAAAQDVLARAAKWEEAQKAADSAASGLLGGLTLTAETAGLHAWAERVTTPEGLVVEATDDATVDEGLRAIVAEWSSTQAAGGEAAGDFARALDPPKFRAEDHGPGLPHPDTTDLVAALAKAEEFADDPACAAAFVNALVPDGLAKWCKLAARTTIDAAEQADVIAPLSRLIGTATRSGAALDPKARQAVLDSPCLDTLVHAGEFDTAFACEAARRILDHPERARRIDATDRLYTAIDSNGHALTGDARYGALLLLANNPAAAQLMCEVRPKLDAKANPLRYQDGEHKGQIIPDGTDRRLPILKALEARGLTGQAAAGALDAGLADLTRQESVNTLELALRMVAHDHLHPRGPGKLVLARLVTDPAIVNRSSDGKRVEPGLFSHQDRALDTMDWETGWDRFNIPRQTLGMAFAKLMEDDSARAELMSGLSLQAAELLRDAAREAGQRHVLPEGSPEQIRVYLDAVERIGEVFGATIAGAKWVGDKPKEPTPFLVAGIELLISEAAKALPGGAVVSEVVGAGAKATAKAGFDIRQREAELKRLKPEQLQSRLLDSLKVLIFTTLLQDEGFVHQMIPPGSPGAEVLRNEGFLDEHGRIRMPAPDDTEAWNRFSPALRAKDSPLGPFLDRAVERARSSLIA